MSILEWQQQGPIGSASSTSCLSGTWAVGSLAATYSVVGKHTQTCSDAKVISRNKTCAGHVLSHPAALVEPEPEAGRALTFCLLHVPHKMQLAPLTPTEFCKRCAEVPVAY